MCRRILLTSVAAVLATYQGKVYDKISVDSRCAMSNDNNPELLQCVLSFANSDKPGVIILSPFQKIDTAEFTDVVPDDALIIEYVEPEQETADADQDNQPDADA